MIIFTDHAKDKILKELSKLKVTEQSAMEITRAPDELLYDSLTNRFVAIGRSRNIAVIYEKANGDFIVVTVIYSSELIDATNKRKRSGRWI